MYWLPKLHKRPYKSRFISASSKCTTTKLSVLLTTALTTIKELVINYCNKVYENSGVNYFWSVKNSGEVLDKLNSFNCHFTAVDSFDFSTLYTTLPHHLIKEKLGALIKWSFKKSELEFICCNSFNSFFSHSRTKNYCHWTCGDMIDALYMLLDNIFVRFGTKVYRQVIGIPMGTNCAPLIADLFLYCYESTFMKNLQKNPIHSSLIDVFNSNSRYLDDILTLNNPDFLKFASDIYPKELILNRANSDNQCCPFLDLNITLNQGKLTTRIYDKRDDFNFVITNFPFLDGDVPQAPSYGVYISQLVRFARICSNVEDFNIRNKSITKKLLQQGFRFHKLLATFRKFYNKYEHLVTKYNVTRRQLISEGVSHPKFYGNVVNKCKKLKNQLSRLGKTLKSYVCKGYKHDILVVSVNLTLCSNDLKILNKYWPLTKTADFN